MRGFGAMCLLRRSRCVFLAPQCTALRCPWVSALVLPVVRVSSCARGPPGVLFTAHLYMYNKSVLQYCIGTKKRRPPRTDPERNPFNIKDEAVRTTSSVFPTTYRSLGRFTNDRECVFPCSSSRLSSSRLLVSRMISHFARRPFSLLNSETNPPGTPV